MVLEWLNRKLAAFLTKRVESRSISTSEFDALKDCLGPGDVLLIDGDTRIAKVIKYLTQSTWWGFARKISITSSAFQRNRSDTNTT